MFMIVVRSIIVRSIKEYAVLQYVDHLREKMVSGRLPSTLCLTLQSRSAMVVCVHLFSV